MAWWNLSAAHRACNMRIQSTSNRPFTNKLVCVCDESIVQSMAYLTWYTTFLFCYFNFYLILGIFLICVVCTDWFIFGIEYCAFSKQPLVLLIFYAFTNPVDGIGWFEWSIHLYIQASGQKVKARVVLTCTNGSLSQPPSCNCGQRQTMNHIVDTCPLTKFKDRLNLFHAVIWLESTALAKWINNKGSFDWLAVNF